MKFYIQQSVLDRLSRISHKMDSTGKQTAQISIGPAKGFVEAALADDGKCGDCPNGPGGGKLETCGIDWDECKRFYADLKVKL